MSGDYLRHSPATDYVVCHSLRISRDGTTFSIHALIQRRDNLGRVTDMGDATHRLLSGLTFEQANRIVMRAQQSIFIPVADL